VNPITHYLASWTLASLPGGLRRADRAWILVAGVAPDLDGLGIVAELATRDSATPLLWWSEYHHTLGHNALFGAVVATGVLAFTRRPKVAGLALASFHLHLLCDLVGSRGPDGDQWPIPYLWPFSSAVNLTVPWQWQLNAWPNIALSVVLLAYSLWVSYAAGRSPLEPFWSSGNRALVAALRGRFSSLRK